MYPAGFLYFYSIVWALTDHGKNIYIGQLLFAFLQALTLSLVFLIYQKAKMPLSAVFLLFFSKRIHSIYTLRLFNDPVAMLFLYLSLLSLYYKKWSLSGILMSCAVSVKMNILLFFPGYALVLTRSIGIQGSISNYY